MYYYNRKYGRDGHLFKERFKSEPVNDMAYFTVLLRYIQKLKNNGSKCDKIQIFFVSLPTNKSSIMIVTNQATDTKQNFNATSTRNRIMASTMSVDEYFDELIDKVREDYANL